VKYFHGDEVSILGLLNKYRRILFRLAVLGSIAALLWLSIVYQSGCCAAVFIVLGIVWGTWVYDMRNNTLEEREEIRWLYGDGPRGWH
jgi:hypothetical protein